MLRQGRGEWLEGRYPTTELAIGGGRRNFRPKLQHIARGVCAFLPGFGEEVSGARLPNKGG